MGHHYRAPRIRRRRVDRTTWLMVALTVALLLGGLWACSQLYRGNDPGEVYCPQPGTTATRCY